MPVFEKHRPLLVTSTGLLVVGKLQRCDGVIHLRGERLTSPSAFAPEPAASDFSQAVPAAS